VQQIQQQQQRVAAAGGYVQQAPLPAALQYPATPHTLFLPPPGLDAAAAAAAAATAGQYQAAAGMSAQPIISLPVTPSAPPQPQQQQFQSSNQQQPQQACGFYAGMMGQSAADGAAACAGGAVTRSRTRLRPHELKSFTPAAVPVEPDANTQAGGRLAPSSEPAAEPDEQPAGCTAAFMQQVQAGLSRIGDALRQLVGQQQELSAVVAQQQLSIDQLTATAAAAAAAVPSSCSSGPQHSSSSGDAGDSNSHSAGVSGRADFNPMQAAATARLLFKLPQHDYATHMRSMTCLHRVSRAAPDQQPHVSMQLSDGRQVVPSIAAVDNGCNLMLATWHFCQLMGIGWHRMSVPELRAIDGEVRPSIIGRTKPFVLRLGQGTEQPLDLHIQRGAYVMQGDAGELFDLCIDTETLKPYYAHVNPLYRHLVWFPGAPQGDLSVLAGIPVDTSHPGSGSAAVLLARHGVAAHAVPPGMVAATGSYSSSVGVGSYAAAAIGLQRWCASCCARQRWLSCCHEQQQPSCRREQRTLTAAFLSAVRTAVRNLQHGSNPEGYNRVCELQRDSRRSSIRQCRGS
jgi:hypothetical protein